MICVYCDFPIMFSPAGSYCANMECYTHMQRDEPDRKQIESYELKRRRRDGKADPDMPEEDRIRMVQNSICDCEQAKALWQAIRK